MKKISFRISILVPFTTLLLLTATLLVGNFFIGSSKIVLELSERITEEVAEKVIERVMNYLDRPAQQARALAKLPEARELSEEYRDLWEDAWDQMLILPQIQSIAFADRDGNFVELRREPDFATYFIDRSKGAATGILIHRTKDFKIVKTEILKTTFDPRQQDWYRNTGVEERIYWSDVYRLADAKEAGVSATYPILDKNGEKQAVVSISIPLHSLSEFILQQKVSANGIVFIVNERLELVIFPDPNLTMRIDPETNALRMTHVNELEQPWIQDAFREYKKSDKSDIITRTDGKIYITDILRFPEAFASHWHTVVILPEADLLGSVTDLLYYSLAITVLILVFALLGIYFAVNRITKPIQLLVEETRKIRDFDLDNVSGVDSALLEIDDMSRAVVATTQGLQSFKKYVPDDLVRQLISLGQEAKLGGERAELTIFFSDIANFTTISEGLPPEELMIHLSEYLESLTGIVMGEQGTIDKYIGDAIMAFWGAPTKLENAPQAACRAALFCQEKLEGLNREWAAAGKPVMETRIGLHTGPAIVGNMGSSERMNYSIIGDNVNLAARLEGANKLYGTRILISADTYAQVERDFFCRSLDIVAVKGKSKGVKVYELVAAKGQTIKKRRKDFCDYFERAFGLYLERDWSGALGILQELNKHFPDDKSVALYVKRCEGFRLDSEGLPDDWDGTVALTEK